MYIYMYVYIGGIQSLAALTRVINALKGNTCAGDSQNSLNGSHSPTTSVPLGASNTKHHIPYRDSLFTQLLKPSLQGNCNICITTIDCTSQSLASMLWFATNIGSLYNTIHINSASRQPHVFITEEFQLKLNAFAYKTKRRAEKAGPTIRYGPTEGNVNSQTSGAEDMHVNPMVAFKGLLSVFESNIDYLANFSESFWSMDAEKERQKQHSLSTMGISCIIPTPIDGNDDDEKERVNIDNEISHLLNLVGSQFHKDKENLEHLPDDSETLPIHEKVELLSSGRISPKLDKQLIQRKKSLGGSSIRRNGSDDIVAGVSASAHSSITMGSAHSSIRTARYSINHEEIGSAILPSQHTIDDSSFLPLILPSPSNEEDSYSDSNTNEQSDGNKRHNSLNDKEKERIQLPGFISPKRNSLTYKINSKIEKIEFPPIRVLRRPSSATKSNATRRPTSALRTNRKGQRTSDPTPLSEYDLQEMKQNDAQNISISVSTGITTSDAIDRKVIYMFIYNIYIYIMYICI
jgi:hypothetical protein